MRTCYFGLFLFSLLPIKLSSQPFDTLILHEEVLALHTFENKKAFLERIYEADQNYRGKQSNDSLDFSHLLSISYFINEYGYPKAKHYGSCAATPWLVWVHNDYKAIDRLTFPILQTGYVSGEIKEEELRSYFLRGLYYSRFDDEAYQKLPISQLFEACEVYVGLEVPVQKVIQEWNKMKRLETLETLEQSVWKSSSSTKTYELDGNNVTYDFEGETIILVKKENGKIYLKRLIENGRGELQELEILSVNKFRLKGQQSECYYQLQEELLQYRNEEEVIKEYQRIN